MMIIRVRNITEVEAVDEAILKTLNVSIDKYGYGVYRNPDNSSGNDIYIDLNRLKEVDKFFKPIIIEWQDVYNAIKLFQRKQTINKLINRYDN